MECVWRKVPHGAPYVALKVELGDELDAALSRLKHAWDMWNAVPVLVTTPAKVGRARDVVRGSFHEIEGEIRIIPWPKIRDLYGAKAQLKQLEAELRIF